MKIPKNLSSASEILAASTLLVSFAVRGDLPPLGQVTSIQLMAGLFPRPLTVFTLHWHLAMVSFGVYMASLWS